MKVIDNVTGAILESKNKFVTGQWQKNPERFAVYGMGKGIDLSKPVDEMTVKELDTYAQVYDIDLEGATTKADKLAVILAFIEENGEPDGEDPDEDTEDE